MAEQAVAVAVTVEEPLPLATSVLRLEEIYRAVGFAKVTKNATPMCKMGEVRHVERRTLESVFQGDPSAWVEAASSTN